jgi:hypothetical protein
MHLRHLEQLIAEGFAMTLMVLAFLVILSYLANSGAAARVAGVPVVGAGVVALRAVTNQVVTPVTAL